MKKDEAAKASMASKEKIRRSPVCIWHCGLINEKIRKATESGLFSVRIEFDPNHYTVRHYDVFLQLYRNEGYHITFVPNYKYIKPTKWIMTISWE